MAFLINAGRGGSGAPCAPPQSSSSRRPETRRCQSRCQPGGVVVNARSEAGSRNNNHKHARRRRTDPNAITVTYPSPSSSAWDMAMFTMPVVVVRGAKRSGTGNGEGSSRRVYAGPAKSRQVSTRHPLFTPHPVPPPFYDVRLKRPSFIVGWSSRQTETSSSRSICPRKGMATNNMVVRA